jgi:23S rRNA U2552 (ribose-2'-O)-methylase RlmE/FtsJ
MFKRIASNIVRRFGYQFFKLDPHGEKVRNEVVLKSKSIIEKISPDYKILNGPFAGIKYPHLNISEASLCPKILGSYEGHLHSVINMIMEVPYENIIDIGSAEGYYAVGLAKHMPGTKVYCFDINEKDMDFCREMADLNNLNNLIFNKECNPGTLIDFKYGNKALIICDCEGYEFELFTEDVIEKLDNVDLLIELHNHVNPRITSTLVQRFQKTHKMNFYDNWQAPTSSWKGLEKLSEKEAQFCAMEHRGGYYKNTFMQWIFLSANPKTDQPYVKK